MRLDPERELASATVDAIRDLVEPRAIAEVDDSALLALALGVADAETRQACARAILFSPATRARLMAIRSGVNANFTVPRPEASERDDLRRLSIFAAAFDSAAARTVYPEGFGDSIRLRRLAEGGWIDSTEGPRGGLYTLPDRFRGEATEFDRETQARYVRYFADTALWINRTLAEGRWVEAVETLRRTMPDLRSAWQRADRLGDVEAVATFVDSLTAELTESGEWDALADLAQVGYRASDALDVPRLRSKLLSFEGVAAARRGDYARTVELWTARVELNRRIGNAGAEADTLLDLASEATAMNDEPAYQKWITQAEDAVARAGRADFTAALWTLRAQRAILVEDLVAAAASAERAIAVYSGTMGIDHGFQVKLVAARIYCQCGQTRRALALVSDLLALALEANRPLPASVILEGVAQVLEADGRLGLAEKSLQVAASIQRPVGARRLGRVEAEIARLRASLPEATPIELEESWEKGVEAILAELRELQPEFVLA